MRNYILNCILSPELSESQIAGVKERISSLIQNKGGTLSKTAGIGEMVLGYEIKKFNKGFLELFYFSIDPEKLPLLEAKLKEENTDVLRFLIEQKKQARGRDQVRLRTPKKEETMKPQKAKLKEIDRKIEEILKD